MAARNPKQRAERAHNLRQQVLAAFSSKAKREGIASVMMAELASELRMSASTLYQLYPSKQALVLACVDGWAEEFAASEAARAEASHPGDSLAGFMHWLDAWADA